MTQEEINKIFPPEYGGNAQISDLRTVLSKISDSDQIKEFVVQPAAGGGLEMMPARDDILSLHLNKDGYGITNLYATNFDQTSNYSGASIVASTDPDPYTNQVFMSYVGPGFYDAKLADRGSLMTDSSLIIAAYNDTDKQGAPSFVAFHIGHDYYNQKEIARIDKDGFILDNTAGLYYPKMKAAQTPKAGANLLQIDTSGEVYSTPRVTDPGDVDPSTITLSELAQEYNTLLDNLRAAGIIEPVR